MVLFAVALVCWVVLSVPAAVLIGKCISRGLEPPAYTPTSAGLPQQRTASEQEHARPSAQAGRSQA